MGTRVPGYVYQNHHASKTMLLYDLTAIQLVTSETQQLENEMIYYSLQLIKNKQLLQKLAGNDFNAICVQKVAYWCIK